MFSLRELCRIDLDDWNKLKALHLVGNEVVFQNANEKKIVEAFSTKCSLIESNLEEERHVKDNALALKENIDVEYTINKADNLFSKFTECQLEDIIAAPNDEKIFVNAGPGTGKTYALIQRINHLVSEQCVEASGIVVLCYTNAAVNEIRNRLKSFIESGQGSRRLIQVDVRTFHSFAFWLIDQMHLLLKSDSIDDGTKFKLALAKSQNKRIEKSVYDQVLLEVCNILSVKAIPDMIFENWQHLIIDEVQDITNNLAFFVLKLIEACIKCDGTGITILGDSCQAIYDYTKKYDVVHKIPSQVFYEKVVDILDGNAKLYSLSVNRRQSEQLQILNGKLRIAILKKDFVGMRNAVQDILDSNLVISNFDKNFIDMLVSKGTVCFLTRSNLEVLQLSSELRKKKIQHSILVKSDFEGLIEKDFQKLAPWISVFFGKFAKSHMTKDEFLRGIELSGCKVNVDAVWKKCCNLLDIDWKCDNIDTVKLLTVIKNYGEKDSIFRDCFLSNVIVSDIHMSKGREYDSIILPENVVKKIIESTAVSIDEYKVLYVAFTRPRNRIAFINCHAAEYYSNHRFVKGDLVVKRKFNRVLKKLVFIPGIDISYISGWQIPLETFAGVNISDEVIIARNEKGLYLLKVRQNYGQFKTVGIVSKDFLISYKTVFGVFNLPEKFTGLYVSGIFTAILTKERAKKFSESYLEKIQTRCPNLMWQCVEVSGICEPL